jgi:mono/diheme cytochrome c family protein
MMIGDQRLEYAMSMPRIVCTMLIVAAILVLAGQERAKADAARGQALSQQWCSQCHAVRPAEASVNPKAPAFAAIATEPSATEYSLQTFLKTPHPTMPNFILKPDDIDDIVEYIVSLKPQK